jgi:hypothetical protein
LTLLVKSTDPRSRWYQDREVADLIEHLDAEERYGNWDALGDGELRAIEKEIDRCRKDFVYAARNYFWIVDDHGNEEHFCLWPSQEIIYGVLEELRAKGKAQKIQIVKSRRLGCSTLVEGLIAWSTIFNSNRIGIVVSYDRDHTKSLLGIMLGIYDKLPWWIKPRVLSRTFESGLVFDNPDHELRRIDPGTQSRVMLKSGNAITGVGQGYRISAAHISEYCDFLDTCARNIIEEDLRHAIQPGPEAFAFLESTAKGANRYAHKLWKRSEELAENAEWYPLFLGWFVDKTHVRISHKNQIFEPEVMQMRERVRDEWVRCNNPGCDRYFVRWKMRLDQAGQLCSSCKDGTLNPVVLANEQLAWIQHLRLNAEGDVDSQKKLAQEQACVIGPTKISTEMGILSIDACQQARSTETGTVEQWYSHGEREVALLKTKMGRELVCTLDERIYTPSGECVDVLKLNPGDSISLSAPVLSRDYFTAVFEFSGRISLTSKIDEDWGLLLGYFMGDGCWSGHGIRFTIDEKDYDIVSEVAVLCERIIGFPSRIEKSNQYKAYIVSSSYKDWDRILTGLGCIKHGDGRTMRKVCVPDCIWRSPRPVVSNFLSALFECDGHAYRDSPAATLFTKYPQFARDVQLLLLSFGINCRIAEENKKGCFGKPYEYIGRSIKIQAIASQIFYRDIGFRGVRKRTSACVRPPRLNTTVKNKMEDTVLSVERCGRQPVYDLTINHTHRFGANGILVHNTTANESFQVTGYQVFGKVAQDFADLSVAHPILTGFFDPRGRVHAVDPRRTKLDENGNPIPETISCIVEGCNENHYLDDCPLRLWEMPDPTARYYIGADVSEGLGGNCDFSAAAVIRMSRSGVGMTYHVATWRSNRISPQDFAEQLNMLGHFYNTAEIAVEVNRYDTTSTWLRTNCQYPNLYRWKHMDSINVMSNKIGWFTQMTSRPRLHQNFRRFLEYKIFYVRDHIVAEEMKNFVKDDYDDRTAGADSDTHDDTLFATMIALWCAYEGEYDETRGFVPLSREPTAAISEYKFICQACGHTWYGDANTIPQMGDYKDQLRCQNQSCNSIRVAFEQNLKRVIKNPQEYIDPGTLGALHSRIFESDSENKQPEYWSL